MKTTKADAAARRTVRHLTGPARWAWWPFLPVMRPAPGREPELGLVYDALHHSGRTGYSGTVFLINLFDAFAVPSVEAFLALPREVYDTAEEVVAAGWRVD